MSLENKKIILFDFDGVLIDTLGICYSINQEVNDNLSLDEYRSFSMGNVFEAKRTDGSSKKRHPDFANQYDLRARQIIIPDALKIIVKELSSLYVLNVISSTYTESIKTILRREGILDCFTEILGADIEINKVKKINFVLNKYNILPKDAVFITDTVGDIKEARECKVNSVAVTWGFHNKETLEKAGPACVVEDPKDLVTAIKNVLK
jgi:phosphoglycolate phosphatase-like HAD superfamily hydrolase